MEDAALAGLRLLVAGDDPGAVQAARERLAALGADVLAGDPESVARASIANPPAAVLALGTAETTLRARLDPFGLQAGPPVIALDELETSLAPRLLALIELRALRAQAQDLEHALAGQAVTRRRELDAAAGDTLDRLLQTAGYRDDNTYEHTQRVGELAARLGRALGLGDREVAHLRRAAPLHDLGKIAIPDSILLKPGKLSSEEFEVIKTHAMMGARVLSGSASEAIARAEEIARHHHERFDGSGYPDALSGAAIPLAARIVHVADVYDVLVHERPYRDSFTPEAAAAEIARGAGGEFDPDVARAFARL